MREPYYDDGQAQLFLGDTRDVLRSLPMQSVNCIVTSPPYWGLRDYGTASWEGGTIDCCDHVDKAGPVNAPSAKSTLSTNGGRGPQPGDKYNSESTAQFRSECRKCGARRIDTQIGLEQAPEDYVAALVDVFREARRVLRDDGVLWLNLGSSYNGSGKGLYGDGLSHGTDGVKQKSNAGSVGLSAHPKRAETQREPAYGSGGKESRSSRGPDASYRGLCDGCLGDYQNHLRGIVHSGPPPVQSLLQRGQTDHDNERPDYAPIIATVAPLAAQESTTLESWLQSRGECSRCSSRDAFLLGIDSAVHGAPASVRMKVSKNGKAMPSYSLADRTEDKESSYMAWEHYTSTLKPKDMVPIPWMVAMALQADGWYLRCDIIWSKPNPMPESVTDRPTKAHEYLFLLAKSGETQFWTHRELGRTDTAPSPDYRWIHKETGEESTAEQLGDDWRRVNLWKGHDYYYDADAIREPHSAASIERMKTPLGAMRDRFDQADPKPGNFDNYLERETGWGNPGGRNKRSVWEIATHPYAEAHFATFPEALVRPCVLAGCPEGGTVLDVFAGSGTTMLVAKSLGRRSIGIDLNKKYLDMAGDRIRQLGLF